MDNRNQGFTLIQLAVVITIIGLVVGATFTGRGILHNAELQSVISSVDNYKKAAKLFQEKYKALPGDMPNATSMWGTAAGCPTPAASANPAVATCDGDGDGYIGDAAAGSPDNINGYYWEQMLLWQHLGNAELIQGKYSGTINNVASARLKPGLNIPSSKLGTNGFTFFYSRPIIGDGNYFDADYKHIIVFGNHVSGNAASFSNYGAGLSTIDALQIDTKVDDGKAGLGRVVAFTSTFNSECVDGGAAPTTVYRTAARGTKIDCALIFITGF